MATLTVGRRLPGAALANPLATSVSAGRVAEPLPNRRRRRPGAAAAATPWTHQQQQQPRHHQYHASARTLKPRLYSMGEGYLGSLGQADFEPRARMTPVVGLDDYEVVDVAAGWAHTAVATRCGRLLLFGRPHDVRKALSLRHMWNTFPWLVRANQAMKRILDAPKRRGGGGSSSSSSSSSTAEGEEDDPYYREDVLLAPREFPLPPGERAARVACSGALTAVVTESGRVYCMGANGFGQCGLGGAQQRLNVWTPMTPVAGLDYEADPVVEVALGFQHAVCRTQSGRAWAWGKGERGQLGNGAEATHGSAFPVDIPGDAAVVKVASGFNHSVALTEDGTLWVWGKMQGLGVKEPGGAAGVDVFEDQLFPRAVALGDGDDEAAGEPKAKVVDVACGHFHTTLLIEAVQQQQQQPQQQQRRRLLMFGLRAQVRTMEPVPTPVALPTQDEEEEEEWALAGGAMTHSVLYGRRSGLAFKADFEGEGTVFAPALDGQQQEEEGEEGVAGKRVLRYAEGLVHKLALVDEK